MRIQTWGCGFVFAVAMASAFGEKVDSTYLQPMTAERSYSTAANWLNMKPASGGGTLSFVNQTADCKANFKLDTTNVVLGSVNFGPGGFRMTGEKLTLSGDGVIRSDNTVGTGFSNHLIIPEGSTMTKRGKGKVTIEYGFSGAGKLVLAEGTIVSADGEHFIAEGDIDIRTGHVSWYEPRTTGDVSLGCGNVSYGPDRAKIVVTKGEVTSYAATMKSLTRNSAGGFLELQTGNTIDTLGETEKFLVQGRESDEGFIDASVVSRGKGDLGSRLHFLVYDAEKGFVPAETNAFVQGQSADGKVAVISEDTTITENAAVSALLVENGAQVTIASGVTLTVGDGVHPAGVIWHGTNLRVGTGNPYYWNGPGKLQFKEGADGILYYNGNMSTGSSSWTSEPCVYISKLALAGNKGVTFAGVANDNRDYGTFSLRDSATVGWSGGTHILGIRLQLNDGPTAKALPSPVYVLGDIAHGMGGQLRHNQGYTFTQDYFLSGNGVGNGTSHCGIFNWGGNPSVAFSGRVTLLADAFFVHDNAPVGDNANLVFKGGLTGPGKIVSYEDGGHSRVDLAGPADFEGGVYLTQKAQGIFVTGPNGRPGEGLVKLTSSGSQMMFRKHMDLVCSNDYEIAGPITFSQCTNVTFVGKVSAGGATVCDGLRLGVGTNAANFGAVAGEGVAQVVPDAAGGTLQVGLAGKDFALLPETADGTDGAKLAVEKVSSDTVTLYRGAHSGTTCVREGTLRLCNDVLSSPDIAYWLDASDADSVVTDENGSVVRWKSKAGIEGVEFILPPKVSGTDAFLAPTADGEIDGKTAIKYVNRDKTRCVLVATNTVKKVYPAIVHRTVFMVVKPNRPAMKISNCGVFGKWSADMGQRLGTSGWDVRGENTGTGATFDSTDGLRIDGHVYLVADKGSYYIHRDNQPQVVTMRHEHDYALTFGTTTYKSVGTFQPAIGCYLYATVENRSFDGQVAEVIAFSRLLDESEMKAVENYLSAKWGLDTPHPDFDAGSIPALTGKSALEIEEGAVFDLNGVDLTVSSLSGNGVLTNSSDRAVTLTVKGAETFTGRVCGKVTIVCESATTAKCEVSEDVTLAADGAELTIGEADGGFVTDGLVYWLDAMRPETVLTNESGAVTSWVSRAGSVARFHNPGTVSHGDSKKWTAPERYDDAAVRGRPGVYFARPSGSAVCEGSNALVSVSTATVRTIILVGQIDGGSVGQSGFWQMGASESGFYPTGGSYEKGTITLRTYTGTTYHRYGYPQWAVGINTSTGAELFYDHTYLTSVDGDFPCPAAFVIISELDESANNFSQYKDKLSYLGVGYHKGWIGWLSEVVAYDRRLTASEMRTMKELLMDKWMRGTPTGPYVETRPVLAEGSGLLVSGGGTVDLGGQAATLSRFGGSDGGISNFSSLTVEDAFVFDVVGGRVKKLTVDGDLVIGSQAVAEFLNGDALDRAFQMQPALEVTGDVSGGALKTTVGLPQKWSWDRAGNIWSVIRNGMMLIIR